MSLSVDSLIFVKLTLRNFMSFGNSEVTLRLDDPVVTVIMGENLDTGGENSRNGVGKSAIFDALCYALFGALFRDDMTNAKLVNKMARRGQAMTVTVEFTKGEYAYLIERGEKPSVLRFFRKEKESLDSFTTRVDNKFIYEITQSKAETNKKIEEVIGFNMTLFEYLVENSSESIPFKRLKPDEKRRVMEHLFGFNLLSKRAEELKEERREINKTLVAVESSMEATRQANARIINEIRTMEERAKSWDRQRDADLTTLKESLAILEEANLDEEREVLTLIQELSQSLLGLKHAHQTVASSVEQNRRERSSTVTVADQNDREVKRVETIIAGIDSAVCPTCGQEWVADPNYRATLGESLDELRKDQELLQAELTRLENEKTSLEEKLVLATKELKTAQSDLEEARKIPLVYTSLEEIGSADATYAQFQEQLAARVAEVNPHLESITNLSKNAIKEIDPEAAETIRKLVSHYNLLIDLLVSPDSYLRKAIMERTLPKLNKQMNHYLNLLELPHRVRMLPDMELSITNYGEEFSWGNLSKGQRWRVVLAMNFAFQDVFEALNYPINLLMMDEVIDSGICSRGAENAVNILKEMSAIKKKRVFLVTHRDDIAAQIPHQMTVKMEGNQSWVEQQDD